MGLDVKRNKKGQYRLISTISDGRLHEKPWISEDEAKKILIEREYVRFQDEVIKIALQFPHQYHVNGHFNIEDEKRKVYQEYNNELLASEHYFETIDKKFKEIIQQLKLEF